jgi:hypothetical protein
MFCLLPIEAVQKDALGQRHLDALIGRSFHTNALKPVMARPVTSEFISRVPSYE